VTIRLLRNRNGYSEDGAIFGDIDGRRDQEGASGSGKPGTEGQFVVHDENDADKTGRGKANDEKKKERRNEGKGDGMRWGCRRRMGGMRAMGRSVCGVHCLGQAAPIYSTRLRVSASVVMWRNKWRIFLSI
jgi:hypothetical protein